ncbi:hypothetical protein [Candidatus Poriferisodalis sp.]|uniref:hypothetical protein n=1 Tax=Candidatus Poriferisodalis sp. TaxID=3101277 RepID=UPI003B0193E0
MKPQAKQRVSEAREVLKELDFPRAQSNERSALVLLALLGLTPERPWAEARNPMLGITEMMAFMRDHYEKDYAPNTRETVRRQPIHQFCDAGLATKNPDDPDRPTNSGQTVYQISHIAWSLMLRRGTTEWPGQLAAYLDRVGTLTERLERARELRRIPVRLPSGTQISLSPEARIRSSGRSSKSSARDSFP